MTLVEMPEFIKQARRILSRDERMALLIHVGANPKAGTIMEGTGGVRKLRWGVDDRGKSSGVRAIYYYHNDRVPVFMLALFPKNVKDNLSKAEKNGIRKLVGVLVESYLAGERVKWRSQSNT